MELERIANALELISDRLNDLENDQECIATYLENIMDMVASVVDEDRGCLRVIADTYEQN